MYSNWRMEGLSSLSCSAVMVAPSAFTVVFGRLLLCNVLSSTSSSTVQVADGHVEVVDAFVYLGCLIDSSGGSRGEVLRRIGLARSCMNMLERRIWKSSISLETKLCLFQTYIVPVLMYGCETLATTNYLLSRLDAFDTWALRKILRIPYTCHVSNVEVRRTTGCSPLSHLVTNRCLRLFGHIARSSPHEDHHRALAACIRQVPPDQQEDLATLGSLALWTLALQLPGERPLLETNGDILWTQQHSSRVCSERRRMFGSVFMRHHHVWHELVWFVKWFLLCDAMR